MFLLCRIVAWLLQGLKHLWQRASKESPPATTVVGVAGRQLPCPCAHAPNPPGGARKSSSWRRTVPRSVAASPPTLLTDATPRRPNKGQVGLSMDGSDFLGLPILAGPARRKSCVSMAARKRSEPYAC